MKSMTGYGEATVEARGTRITVQLRSLNHRHLDLQIRAPREYLGFEEEIRKAIREKMKRGRIEVFVGRAPAQEQLRRVELNEALLAEYLRAIERAKKRFQISGEIQLSLLSNFPDLFQVREVEVKPVDEKKSLFKALHSALNKLDMSRQREGRQLKADVESQLRVLKRISAALQEEADQIGIRVQKVAATVKEAGLQVGGDKEPGDANSWVLKGDINEEIVRLQTHLTALASILQERDPVGKKIDFMLQEIQRELNTIGSKLGQLSVIHLVLEGKERVEKIREQTQNIE
jgi:uncharacterized protein (TIGR00255 family)